MGLEGWNREPQLPPPPVGREKEEGLRLNQLPMANDSLNRAMSAYAAARPPQQPRRTWIGDVRVGGLGEVLGEGCAQRGPESSVPLPCTLSHTALHLAAPELCPFTVNL